MSLLQFMGDHPILTFFLALIVAEVVIRLGEAISSRRVVIYRDDEEEE